MSKYQVAGPIDAPEVVEKPTPRTGETRSHFLSRCIPEVIGEGVAQDAAIARCISIWDRRNKEFDVIESLAHICLKEFDSVGPEGLSLSVAVRRLWAPRIKAFLDEMFGSAIDLTTGKYLGINVNLVLEDHRESLVDDFIEAATKPIDKYVDRAFTAGLTQMGDLFTGKVEPRPRVRKDIYDDLARVTGSTRRNVIRTMRRWFRQTQGKYFERFIEVETANLLRRIDDLQIEIGQARTATLNSIGRKYKKFAKADGYWNAVSKFNTAQSNVFAQVQAMQSAGIATYIVSATLDERTCTRCEHWDGAEFSVEIANDRMVSMLDLDADQAAAAFPWPTKQDIERYPNPSDSPFPIPPYHGNCRCIIQPIGITPGAITITR